MKKLLRTIVVTPLYLFVYGAVLVWSFTNPFWGFVTLAVLDLLGLGVAAIIVYRVTVVHGWLTRQEVRPVHGWTVVGLVAMTVLHVVAAFMPSGEAQAAVGYGVPALPVLLGVIYLLMKGRP